MANKIDITVDQGCDEDIVLALYIAEVSPSTTYNISGAQVALTVSSSYSNDPLFTVTAAATGSTVTLVVPAAATAPLKFVGNTLKGVYHLELTLVGGTKKRVAQGAFNINKKIK
jgi:Ni/Fe-hydrogenase subunit HybB-like protein